MAEENVLEIAADWADRIDELDATERRALMTWLNQSERHVRAFARMHELLRDPALLEVLAERQAAAAAPPMPAAVPRRRRSDRASPRPSRRVAGVGLAAIAAGVAALVAVPLLLRQPVRPTQAMAAQESRYGSAIGRRAQVRLADGSMVTLDAASSLRVAFAPNARQVVLEQGAARFEVAHDVARPFSVQTARARFTALGTNFSVDQLGASVELRVYRGRVRVDQSGRAPIVVTGGEWLRVDAAPARVQRFDPKAGSAWENSWLDADQMRLDAALERLGRYSPVPIRLADPALGASRFSGRFRLDRPAESATMIGTLFALAPQRQGDAIVLRAEHR